MLQMDEYLQVIDRVVAPSLAEQGYLYDPSNSEEPVLLKFQKSLAADVISAIEFQRHTYEEETEGFDFRVNLHRSNLKDPSYEGSLSGQLFQVLRYVYQLEDAGDDNHWFVVHEPTDFEVKLNEALDYLQRYGIPWLEDPDSRGFTHIPRQLRVKFHDNLSRIGLPRLAELGYEFEARQNLYVFHFHKRLANERHAHIRVQLLAKMSLVGSGFYIWLLRNGSSDPLDDNTQDLYCDLGGVVMRRREKPSDFLEWTFDDSEEMVIGLNNAVNMIVEVGIPWLEDPASENPLL
jgi:hypothetical protein